MVFWALERGDYHAGNAREPKKTHNQLSLEPFRRRYNQYLIAGRAGRPLSRFRIEIMVHRWTGLP